MTLVESLDSFLSLLLAIQTLKTLAATPDSVDAVARAQRHDLDADIFPMFSGG